MNSEPFVIDEWGCRIHRKRPMTIVAGVIAQNAVILASDSQETDEDGGKKLDLRKIHAIKIFGADCLVGVAGEVVLTDKLISILREVAGAPDERLDCVEKVADEAVRKLRGYLREFEHNNCSAEEFSEIMLKTQRRCSAMIGLVWGGIPLLLTVNINQPISRYVRDRNYSAIGSGSQVAEYLLRDNMPADASPDLASALAIYAVEVAKSHDFGCDGPTQAALIKHLPNWWNPADPGNNAVKFLDAARIDKISTAIKTVEQQAKKERNETLIRLLSDGVTYSLREALEGDADKK